MQKVICDIESEKILINQMILDDSILEDVIQKVPLDSFYNQNYKNCYQIILNLSGRKEKVDFSSFITECKITDSISFDVIEDVTNAISSATTWSYYADNIMKCYQARKLLQAVCEIKESVTRDNSVDLIATLSTEINNIACINDEVKEPTQIEVMKDLVMDLQNYALDTKKALGWSTGLNNLNMVLEGIKPEYIMICARPSMGKTFLAQQIALHIAKEHKVLFMELEMSAKQINYRNVALLADLKLRDLKYEMKNPQYFARANSAIEELGFGTIGKNYKVVEPVSRKLSAITSYIRKSVKKDGTEIVFIDHVGLIQSDTRFGSSWEGAREISNGIQKLQRELNIPVVVLSQRSRDSEGGNNKGNLATIRGSGAFEEDADLILTIEHARATDSSQQEKLGAEKEILDCQLYVAKNRNGACGIAECKFFPAKGRFIDVIK